ncbi:hypothetical protein A4G28_20120 [Mycobacterium ostraviense]|uniref:MMPL family protein n=1 Tax=Mycobacterium ostraviense TaxID=2738409 RepID=A0A163XKP6_9MYCO|nr:hypothetical protein A4G28_20120 [Mycobacterium ostraviense]
MTLRGNAIPDISVLLPEATGLSPAGLDAYAAALSRVPDVSSVTSPGGTFVHGRLAGPPAAPSGIKDRSAFVTVGSTAPLYPAASAVQLDRLHAVPTPAGRPVQLAGVAQSNRDSVHAIATRLPVVLTFIVLITVVLVFLLNSGEVIVDELAVVRCSPVGRQAVCPPAVRGQVHRAGRRRDRRRRAAAVPVGGARSAGAAAGPSRRAQPDSESGPGTGDSAGDFLTNR